MKDTHRLWSQIAGGTSHELNQVMDFTDSTVLGRVLWAKDG